MFGLVVHGGTTSAPASAWEENHTQRQVPSSLYCIGAQSRYYLSDECYDKSDPRKVVYMKL